MFALHHGDCLEIMKAMPDGAADVAITSPPYVDCRTYGVGFNLSGQAWVDWMVPRVAEACRVTAGLVLVNMAGKVRDFRYSPVVEWLVADLTRNHGIVCGPAPYVFYRVGIPGSGGPHYHRRDWEPVYAFALPDNLPPRWSDNTATGHPPKWAPGGEMSNRLSDGARVNQWGHSIDSGATVNVGCGVVRSKGKRPSHFIAGGKGITGGKGEKIKGRRITVGKKDGDTVTSDSYDPPVLANSGNAVKETYTAAEVAELLGQAGDVISCKVGGGLMGDANAHRSEAPMPETLAAFFVLSYCPPDGTVFDPFCGSGTSLAVALKHGRKGLGIDIRDGEGGLATARRRLENITTPALFAEEI